MTDPGALAAVREAMAGYSGVGGVGTAWLLDRYDAVSDLHQPHVWPIGHVSADLLICRHCCIRDPRSNTRTDACHIHHVHSPGSPICATRAALSVGPAIARPAQPPGQSSALIPEREAEVLRLAAEGLGNAEIARKLSYSDRTIKVALKRFTDRFNLRNRAHAVAYALRNGLI